MTAITHLCTKETLSSSINTIEPGDAAWWERQLREELVRDMKLIERFTGVVTDHRLEARVRRSTLEKKLGLASGAIRSWENGSVCPIACEYYSVVGELGPNAYISASRLLTDFYIELNRRRELAKISLEKLYSELHPNVHVLNAGCTSSSNKNPEPPALMMAA